MSLNPGARLGVFEIVSPLGAGGMGEVYRAHDTRLGRDVAIKVLPELFAQDAERLSRFQREAQLLASLNHPNIAVIHGLEEVGGVRALVLELVEGETIADRLLRGPIPVEEAVAICRQIAEALEAAHERGIIHRDLKPANVKIAPDGKVKVLDFGLAKAMESGPVASQLTHSPTLSLGGTFAGVILGTAAYMSPEQAKGLPADQRSDVFSFGCLLYEMLTSRQAFQADTASETMAAVLLREIDVSALPSGLHARLYELVRRCTEKNPKRRWQAIGDVRYELDAVAADPRGVAVRTAPSVPASTWSRGLWTASVIAAATIAAAVASVVSRSTVKAPAPPLVTTFPIAIPDDQQFLRLSAQTLALSPDGSKLAYAVNRQLYLRSMSEMTARPISGTALDVTSPFFSPDGQWIGFFSIQDQTLKKIAVTGGAAVTLCKTESMGGAHWEGDQIAFAVPTKGIMRVSANGGEPVRIVSIATNEIVYGPQLLDRGAAVLYTLTTGGLGLERWDKAQVVVESIGSGQRTVVVRGGSDARYLPTGHLVYGLSTSILAIPFDVGRRETKGGPVPVIESVVRAPNPATQTGVAHFATSASGSLAYVPSTANRLAGPKLLSLIDPGGKAQPIPLPPQMYSYPRLSPDGLSIAVTIDDGRESNVWVYDLKQAHGSLRRLTFGGRNQFPIWSPDSRSITFQSDRDGEPAIFRQLADGSSGSAERLTKPEPGAQHEPESWSPDGKTLSFDNVSGSNQGVWTVTFDADRKPKVFVDAPENTVEKHSVFSPNGRWIAYMAAPLSAIAVSTEVYVQPFPPSGAKYQISTGGGRTPVWSPDGKRLFYHEPGLNRLMVVDIRTEPSFSFGQPIALPIDGTIHPLSQRNFDIAPDGRLLVVVPASARASEPDRSMQQINVVLNWFEELKTRVPVSK